MIRLDKVAFSYPNTARLVLKDLSLSIDAHSWVSLTGPDGSGKTSLAKLIAGLYRPVSGTITLDADPRGTSPFVGYLGGDPQDSLVGTSVQEDMAFGLENMQVPSREIKARVERALQWTGLEGMEERLTHTLSGGEQQRLALAAMLALDARVLILDEALSMLDRPMRRTIRRLIAALRKSRGMTVVQITHDLDEALSADRLIFLSDRGISFDGTPEDFASSREGREWARKGWGLTTLLDALSVPGISAPRIEFVRELLKEMIWRNKT